MRVRIKVNLGSRDAERLDLRFEQCCKGMALEVADEAGEWLIRHGIADQLESKPVVGVAPRPTIAEAQVPEIQAPEIQLTPSPGRKAGSKHKES